MSKVVHNEKAITCSITLSQMEWRDHHDNGLEQQQELVNLKEFVQKR